MENLKKKAFAYLSDLKTGNIDILNAELNEDIIFGCVQFLHEDITSENCTIEFQVNVFDLKSFLQQNKYGFDLGEIPLRVSERARHFEMVFEAVSQTELCEMLGDYLMTVSHEFFSDKYMTQDELVRVASECGLSFELSSTGLVFPVNGETVVHIKNRGKQGERGAYELNYTDSEGRIYFNKGIETNFVSILYRAGLLVCGEWTKKNLERAYEKNRLTPYYGRKSGIRKNSNKKYLYAG